MRRSTEGQLMSLISLGDGSTLTLDFTTGQLDPRLTFTRASNATFINSSGLVQYADANMFVNSAWTDANNTPTGWILGTSTGAVSRSNETRTFTCAAQQYWLYQQPASRTGLTYSISVEVTAVSGSMVYGDIILAGSSTYLGWYKDGVLQATGTSTPVTTGVITLIFTANSDNTILRLGLGAAGTNVTGSVTLRYPQFQPGQVPIRSYYENTSTSAARYDSARFDYDPTTLAPQGLLIEGTATNIAFYSQTINPNAAPWNVYWFVGGAGSSVTPVSQADPANTTTASRCVLGASGGRVYNGISTSAGVTYTLSFWAKSISGPTSLAFWHFNSATGNSTSVTVTTSWQRYQVSILGRTGGGFVEFGIANNTGTAATVDFWGLQVETGSGASSYIPTGASQVTRLADFCSITSPNFAPWYGSPTGWTIVAEMTPQSRAAGSFPGMLALRSAADSGLRIYYYNDGTYNTAFRFATASTNAEVFGPNGVTYGVPRKFGASVTSGTQFASSAGVQIGSTQTLAVPMDQTLLAIGSDGVSPTPTVNCRMNFRSIKYWPYAMTLADLNARTA